MNYQDSSFLGLKFMDCQFKYFGVNASIDNKARKLSFIYSNILLLNDVRIKMSIIPRFYKSSFSI